MKSCRVGVYHTRAVALGQSEKQKSQEKRRSVRLVLVIILIFALMGTSIWAISKKTYDDMSDAAISSLNENLNLMKSTVEAIFRSEADFQRLTAEELAEESDPLTAITHIRGGDLASCISLVPVGASEGVSNNGEPFDPATLDFSDGESVYGLSLSSSYVNTMGTWAYTMACPVMRDDEQIATLYMEYAFDAIDDALPYGFYGDRAVLYLMDTSNERFVLKPEGMGERDAGHLNLDDFYHANNISDPRILDMVAQSIAERRNVMFAHKVLGEDSLCFLWSINDGTTYLVGYVPMKAIQKEAQAVNIALLLVVGVTVLAFCLCVALFAYNQHKQSLAQKAREAERAEHAEQLSKALQAAQLANESKSVFLANMSHDIRTPMNAVLGFATLISHEADDPAKVRDYAHKINSSGRHLLDLINDVLDISKIESGKATLKLEELDLGDLLAAAESIIAPMAANKGQMFCTEITAIHHEHVIGDRTHLNQILINLLSNAVKYTPEGGKIWLRFIGLPQRSEQRERIRIEVEDTGYGMTPEYLETIFDAFTRAENSTTNKIQGTGLGMSITKSLVDLMGGSISVKSEEGVGSLFTVDLELRIPEDQALSAFWKRAGIERMLVMEPCVSSLEMIRDCMEGTGVKLDVVTSSEEACEAASSSEYQLILYGCKVLDEQVLAQAHCMLEKDAERISSGADQASAAPHVAPIVIFMQDQGGAGTDHLALPPRSEVLTRPFFPSMLKAKIADVLDFEGDGASQFDGVLQGLHFLAAEDNFFNAAILTDFLEMEGASVEIVENGQLAVERFETCEPGEFDAILMDVQMPVMNGHQATRAIRALSRADAKTIPIFAMTADAFSEDEQAALAAGMNVHLTKPIEIENLKRAVDRFVKKGHTS